MSAYIAHVRERDGTEQSLEDHLTGVAERAQQNAEKIGLGKIGELLGLLHDVGKYSDAFQQYIRSAEGLIDQDSDEYVDVAKRRGKIDHSTAGSQIVWRALSDADSVVREVTAQILALILASHHSGLIDCLKPDGADLFTRRMVKEDSLTHLSEVRLKLPHSLIQRIEDLLEDAALVSSLHAFLTAIREKEKRIPEGKFRRACFKTGLLLRMLFSSLIDADRTDTADFERGHDSRSHIKGETCDWEVLMERLENHLAVLASESPLDQDRRAISDHCRCAAAREKGIFTLTVPTGAGKTLASLRFALHHALRYKDTPQKIDRIFYIIPYTSIIDQNADSVRKILEPAEEKGKIVLECHSNLTSEQETWRNRLLAENWDAPIIFTTSVQFLETLFGGGTRNARRTHRFASSIFIFDEIQTLPVRVVHLFCNAINFLTEQCGASAILCTATQPLLNGVDKTQGAAAYIPDDEIMPNTSELFERFRRVEVIDRTRSRGYTDEETAALTLEERSLFGTCLTIVNTTETARKVYNIVNEEFGNTVHLSANMCPAHRMKVLNKIRADLSDNPQIPLICISTQVIEAGVDVDFGAVVRCLAGLDSIAQAAGRCNRHGRRKRGRVSIINLNGENIEKLTDIRKGRDIMRLILAERKSDPDAAVADLLAPDVMDRYFRHYFYERAMEMRYEVRGERDDSLLNMLSENTYANHEYLRGKPSRPLPLRQSFASASEIFKAIDAPTRGIVVPYEEGEDIVTQLCGDFNPSKNAPLIRRLQQYTVNVYPHTFDILAQRNALHEIKMSDGVGLGIWTLNPAHYDSKFGLSREPVSKLQTVQT